MKLIRCILAIAVISPWALATVSAADKPAATPSALDDDSCLQCHSDKTLTKTDKAGKEVSLFVDTAVIKASAHSAQTCAGCHSDLTENHPDEKIAAKPVDCRGCHELQSVSYEKSAHGIALNQGNKSAPNCVDCHGAHTVLAPTSPASSLYFTHLAQTCGSCHGQESQDVQASVHGRAAAKGERESATCVDCHNDHQMESLKGASSYKISIEICSKPPGMEFETSPRAEAGPISQLSQIWNKSTNNQPMKKLLAITLAITALATWSARADDAKTLYDAKCAKCHGEDGKGQKVMGKHLGCKDYTDPKVQAALTDDAAIKATKEGLTDPTGKVLMKPEPTLSDDDVKALVAYMRTFKP